MKTVIGLFDNLTQAQDVVQTLISNGFNRDDISLMASNTTGEQSGSAGLNLTDTDDSSAEVDGAVKGAGAGAALGGLAGLLVGLGALAIPGVGPVIAAGPIAGALGGAGLGAMAGGLIGALTKWGVPKEKAEYYAEGVRRGGTLVSVRTDDENADLAAEIMEDHDALDINERAAQWQQSGWSGFEYNETERAALANIPVVEEDLQVGKREVQRGGVHVYSHIEEVPVEEDIRLREEHVSVERRPVDRPLSAADNDAFKEEDIEISETAEEPVISKQARVKEEIVVNKDVGERTEKIRDTVRRTKVDIEKRPHQPR